MKSTGRKLGFIIMAAVLAGTLVLPALSPLPSLADDPVTVYFRILGPADQGTFNETGEYYIIWEGEVTVPTEVYIDTIAGNTWHLYVNESNEHWADCTTGPDQGDSHYIGEADYIKGATSVLAALDEASQPDNGDFTYLVSDAYISMGFFISAIGGYAGVGADGWCYRVWNPDGAGLSPMGIDTFLLDYSTMPIDTPHQQVLWYWGGSGCYPLRVTTGLSAVAVGQEFTATVEYFSDYGHGPAGDWVPLAGATVNVGSETFTTDDNGEVKVFLESAGDYALTASKGYDGSNIYVPTDDSTVVTVSGGDTSDWWIQTSEAHFSDGAVHQVDTETSPGDVVLDTGGTVTEDYILDGGTDTLGGEYFYDQFQIINGATLYVTDGQPLIIHANSIEIDTASKIDADGRGYDGGSGGSSANDWTGDDGFGPGAGCGGVHLDVHGGGGGGASHSGAGGAGSRWWSESAAQGYTYGGSCESGDHTFYLGSGGGGGGGDGSSNQGGDGGDGGGAVRLEAPTVVIHGEINAAGIDGSDGAAAGCGGGGGGSGGTIYIAGDDITIDDGVLNVAAGDGGNGGGSNGHGAGGGGGGYIKVFYESVNESSGHNVSRGWGGSGNPYPGLWGLGGSGEEKGDWFPETFSPTLPYYAEGTLESASQETVYTAADFGKIRWCSATPSGTDVKFQIATNKDNLNWDFKGPDGTDSTYYEASGADIWSGHDGDRYIKYKAFFSTTEPGKTTTLSKVGITYTEGSITEVISLTVTDYDNDGIKFGSLDPGTGDQPADWGDSVGTATITIGSETNVDVNVQLKGTDFTGPGTITIGNVKYDGDDNPDEARTLTDGYITWYAVAQPLTADDVTQVYYWITIPPGQLPGDYTSTFYYRATTSS